MPFLSLFVRVINLCEKLVSSLELPIELDESSKASSVPFLLQILAY